jgi:carboxymethylenebutenolidase
MSMIAVPNGAPTRRLRAYLVRPDTAGPWPGVVVIHEATGLNTDVRRHADRIAASGYLALAPDLYSAGGALRCLRATFRSLRTGRGPAVDDLLAARQWLTEHPSCTGRVGVLGFCVGGGFALLLATRGFHASAANYAPVPDHAQDALAGACPVVASYGGRDRFFRHAPERLRDTLTSLDIEHDVQVYPRAGHSFMNRHPFGPMAPLLRVAGLGHDHAAAEHAWGRIVEFFDKHLHP